jgi:hypothetical protein
MNESLLPILAWLAGACFCGILPLGIAAILFFSSRKRAKVGSAVGTAVKTKTAALKPGASLVRLQGRIAPQENAIDGAAENAVVYLRLKVEVYERDEDSSGWRGLTDKARGIPFLLDDGTGAVWVNPDGLDKQLLGEGMVPDEHQIQAACILLEISPKMLRGQLRFRLWQLQAGQTISVIGSPVQAPDGMTVMRLQGQPLVISPLLGQAVDDAISGQTRKGQIWTLVLGILGILMLLCGLAGALVSLVKLLSGN